MESVTNQAKESLENAIIYFKNLPLIYPAIRVREDFHKILLARLERFIDGYAKAATKTIVKNFVCSCGDEYIDSIASGLREACEGMMEYLRAARKYAAYYEELEGEIADLEVKREGLQIQIKKLQTDFPDPRARAAFDLYQRISAPVEEGEAPQTTQRRITAAGLMAAAYLGLERYEIGTQRQTTKE